MKPSLSKLCRYEFEVSLITPMSFNEASCLSLGENCYKIMGNSIAGMLRNYLCKTEIDSKSLQSIMGGDEDEEDDFISSKIIINDGFIRCDGKEYRKEIEGTAINSETGTASRNKKYKFEVIPKGATLKFLIEFETDLEHEKEWTKFIRTLAEGFVNRSIHIGGHKSTDFGKLDFIQLSQWTLTLDSVDKIDNYLLNDDGWALAVFTKEKLEKLCSNYYIENKIRKFTFTMKGEFPYGVYQGYKVSDSLTGIKDGIIPASSFKGVFRHESEKLVNVLCKDMNPIELKNHIEKKLSEIFGSCERSGCVYFETVNAPLKKVEIRRAKPNQTEVDSQENSNKPCYIKIDRFTGGVIGKAIQKTEELIGETTISVTLSTFNENIEAFVFPLLYSMVQIGKGQIPIGGKTNIGLGIFSSESLILNESKFLLNDIESNSEVKIYFEAFKRWCFDGN